MRKRPNFIFMIVLGGVLILAGIFAAGLIGNAPEDTPQGQTVGMANPQGYYVAETEKQLTRCQNGDGKACFDAAAAFDQGRGVGQDKPRAAQLYKRACDFEFAGGCVGAALIAQQAPEPAEAVNVQRYLRRACDLQDEASCKKLSARAH